MRGLLAAEGPSEALGRGLPEALLRLRAGRRETIVLALRALLRAGNRGWVDAAGLRAYWRYFGKVGGGFPACIQALVAPPAAGGGFPAPHLQVDVCAFVESLTLLMFPQVFAPSLCVGGDRNETEIETVGSAEGCLPEGLLVACLGAVLMLARRLRFLYWERDPDLAMALHTLLGQLQDQTRWPSRPPWPSSAEYPDSKAAGALEAAQRGLLEALRTEAAPAPPPGGPLERMRAGIRGWRPGRESAIVNSQAKHREEGLVEARGCIEAGMKAASAAEILQPLMRGSALDSPARSSPAPLPGLQRVPRGLFVISEDSETVCPTPPPSARGDLVRKVFSRVGPARLLSSMILGEHEVSQSSSEGSPCASLLSCSGSSASPEMSGAPAAHFVSHTTGGQLGCAHYRRGSALVFPCCDQVFTCSICHDEACDHLADPLSVKAMVCMHCGERQPVTKNCRACESELARYFCETCGFSDNGANTYQCPVCPGEDSSEHSSSSSGLPPASQTRARKRPLSDAGNLPAKECEVAGGAVVDSPGYRARFFQAFREAEQEGKVQGRPRLRDVRHKVLASLDLMDKGLADLAEQMGGASCWNSVVPRQTARLTDAQAAALVGHCMRLQRQLARERAAKKEACAECECEVCPGRGECTCPPDCEACAACPACEGSGSLSLAPAATSASAGSLGLFSSPAPKHSEGVHRWLRLFKAAVWGSVLFASTGFGGRGETHASSNLGWY